jgi:hypothetical protein
MRNIITSPEIGISRAKFGVLLLLILLISGCSAVSTVKKQTKKVASALTGSDAYRKKVILIPFTGKTSVKDRDFENTFQKYLIKALEEECSDILLIKPGDASFPEQMETLPRQISGRLDNLALAEIGKRLGINAVIIVKSVDVNTKEREKGILIFKDAHYFVMVHAGFEVYDTATGAKLMDEPLDRETEVDETDFEAVKAGRLFQTYELNDIAEEITAESGNNICNAINRKPWQGYVISVQKDKIILSSGRESGIKPGDFMDVFDKGEIINGKYGQRFLIPGHKIGEIMITEVFIGKAEAVTIRGIEVKEGFSVRPR